jgi:hypothetical protein
MDRYGTIVEGGTVYVEADLGRIEVGDVEDILDLVGGPAWEITYDAETRSRPDVDTSDEGLTIDVVDTIHEMTFGPTFLRALKAQPAESPFAEPDAVSPRLGLFAGRLLENLEYGVR